MKIILKNTQKLLENNFRTTLETFWKNEVEKAFSYFIPRTTTYVIFDIGIENHREILSYLPAGRQKVLDCKDLKDETKIAVYKAVVLPTLL